METHGKNTQQEVIAIVPGRLSSERLPGKLLLEADGKPVIVHTLERASEASSVDRVIAAVDHEDLFKAVEKAGFEAMMTRSDHQSGTDRVAEAASAIDGEPIIVNVQGDEPMIAPETIDAAVAALIDDPLADISTTWEAIEDGADVLSPDVVKVVIDKDDYAIYFSRSPVPFPREEVGEHGSLSAAFEKVPELHKQYKKHTGLYVFRKDSLVGFTSMPPSPLEISERLEQLRALENGFLIKAVEAAGSSVGVDTAEDLERFRKMISGRGGETAL